MRRPLLLLACCSLPVFAAAQERAPLFPRLHARLHPRPCPCPCVSICPPVAVTAPESVTPPKNVEVPKTFDSVTLRGRVQWPDGKPLPNRVPIPIPLGADRDFFGPAVLPMNLLVDPNSRGIRNVLVWLRPDSDDRTKTFPLNKIVPGVLKPAPKTHSIGVKDGHFEPRVLAAHSGDRLHFSNNTPIAMNFNFNSDIESANVLVKPTAGFSPTKPLEAQRIPISFVCNIHPWMQGRIRVFDHPYFATTDKDGKFEIKNAPVGKWRIVYWHEDGFHKGRDGILGFPIEIKGDRKTLELEPIKLELPALK